MRAEQPFFHKPSRLRPHARSPRLRDEGVESKHNINAGSDSALLLTSGNPDVKPYADAVFAPSSNSESMRQLQSVLCKSVSNHDAETLETPRLSAPTRDGQWIPETRHSTCVEVEEEQTLQSARSFLDDDRSTDTTVTVINPAGFSAESGRHFLEDREYGMFRTQTARQSASKVSDEASFHELTNPSRFRAIIFIEAALGAFRSCMRRAVFSLSGSVKTTTSVAWDTFMPRSLDEEHMDDFLVIALSRRLRTVDLSYRYLAAAVIAYAIVSLALTPVDALRNCALLSVAVIAILFAVHATLRSAYLTHANPRAAAICYSVCVIVLRAVLLVAVLAWMVLNRFSHSTTNHESHASVDCPKAFGSPAIALTGSFLAVPLRPKQV